MTGSTESGKISLVLYVDVEHGVLIETLWNVKKSKLYFINRCCSCINRNIVECKVAYEASKLSKEYRINRNIVECKGILQFRPYFLRCRINRNIVECKEDDTDTKLKNYSVLIETLWNVKRFCIFSSFRVSCVLIETLWNVKVNVCENLFTEFFVLIETLWNVKLN